MPDRVQHRQRAEDNESLANALDLNDTIQVDWAVVMLFYAALHYVDAFLAGKHYHPPDHDARDTEIENNGSISAIYNDYRKLKDKSIAARYEIANFHRNSVPPLRQRYEKIKAHIVPLL